MRPIRRASFFQRLLLGYLVVGAISVATTSYAYFKASRVSITRDIRSDLSRDLNSAVEYFNGSLGSRLESVFGLILGSPTLDAFLRSGKTELLLTQPALETLFIRAIAKNQTLFRSIRFLNTSGEEIVIAEGNRRVRGDGRRAVIRTYGLLGDRIHALFSQCKHDSQELMFVEGPFEYPKGHWTFLVGSPKLDPEVHSIGGVLILECDLTPYIEQLAALRYRGYPTAWVSTPGGAAILSPRTVHAASPSVFTFPTEIKLGSKQQAFLLLTFHNAQEVYSAQLHEILMISAWVGIGTMGLVVLLALAMSRQFSRPLFNLARATNQLATGDRISPVSAGSGSREIQWLVESYNQMIHRLQTTMVSKQYVDNILSSMIDSLVVVGLDRTIQRVNHATCTLLGYRTEELISKPVSILFPDATAINDLFRGDTKSIVTVEKTYVGRDGRQLPVSFSVSTLRTQEQEIDGYVFLAQDITDRKRLEKTVVQFEKMSAVGQLAAGIAHEINNPLGVILGFAEGAGEDMSPEHPLHMPIMSIKREAIRCKALVQNLLTFSRERRSGFSMENPSEMIESALQLVEPKARLKNIQIVREIDASLARVPMNRNQIEQVLINLCVNAMDAMVEGGTLTLRVSRMGDWLEVSVGDTGTGIPANIQKKIFEPFFTTKEVGKGTGLGLSIAFETVKNHQGVLDFTSEPNKGTTFVIRLPFHVVEQAA